MIPLVHPLLGKEEENAVTAVIRSRMVASGAWVDRFEKATASMAGTKFGIATSNGTTALHAALLACGIKAGDKVLTTPLTFIATANSILYCGAKPVFADIDPATFNLSPQCVEKVLRRERNIKAMIVVHLYGMPADMNALGALARKYKVTLIEDCAQAHGARYNGKVVGSFGSASAFSFYATKNIMTGEGGMVLTDDPDIDSRCRQIVNHGRDGHSTHTILGYNYRLTNIAAAIGLAQLKRLKKWSVTRRKNAAYLTRGLKDLTLLKTPVTPAGCEPVFHQYTLRVESSLRARLIEHLTRKGVGCGIYYPATVYNQPLYRDLGYRPGICPEAEKAAAEVVSLPVHPSLTRKDLDVIISAVRSFADRLE